MRATQPVFQHSDWGGWQVFRYADVARVLSEYATFSSDSHRMAQMEDSAGEADPPFRGRYLKSKQARREKQVEETRREIPF